MQEIPASFTAETGWPGAKDCALVTSISTRKEWPIRFRRFPDMAVGGTAMSVGAGWPKFISDQDLGIGAFCTFEVVDDRRLVVGIHRRSANAHALSPHVVRDYRETPEGPNNVPCLYHRPSIHEAHSDGRPHFQKTLRKTHTKKCASARMVSCSPKSLASPHSVVSFRDLRLTEVLMRPQFGDSSVDNLRDILSIYVRMSQPRTGARTVWRGLMGSRTLLLGRCRHGA